MLFNKLIFFKSKFFYFCFIILYVIINQITFLWIFDNSFCFSFFYLFFSKKQIKNKGFFFLLFFYLLFPFSEVIILNKTIRIFTNFWFNFNSLTIYNIPIIIHIYISFNLVYKTIVFWRERGGVWKMEKKKIENRDEKVQNWYFILDLSSDTQEKRER